MAVTVSSQPHSLIPTSVPDFKTQLESLALPTLQVALLQELALFRSVLRLAQASAQSCTVAAIIRNTSSGPVLSRWQWYRNV